MQNLLIAISCSCLFVSLLSGYFLALKKGYSQQRAIVWAITGCLFPPSLPVLLFWPKGEYNSVNYWFSWPIIIAGILVNASFIALYFIWVDAAIEQKTVIQCAANGTAASIHQSLDAGFAEQGFKISKISAPREVYKTSQRVECLANLLLSSGKLVVLEYSVEEEQGKYKVTARGLKEP